eukprot:TRINITY_DN50365_c0_g1_i2.p1 TRINITY_DN50365_c0_g1~~TRINITY_DN50365_c0_g1_i2.p1  ORF type:complete len:424 (-),score=103.65 TRINITY_DN50365_c0_g1_i2:322-1593(-)
MCTRNQDGLRVTSLQLISGGQARTIPGMLKFVVPTAPKVGSEDEDSGNEDGEKAPKRKVAILFGYIGSAYQGLQINPGANSVELHLEKALVAAGCVSKANSFAESDTLSKIQWSRCGRTDKGVHAAGQVVGARLQVTGPSMVDDINNNLPADIRVMSVSRVTKGFNAKIQCSGRSYVYALPLPSLGGGELDIPRMNEILCTYKGTHNFHNFTSMHKAKNLTCATDDAASRYITSASCGPVFEVDGMKFLPLLINGQSFLYNQIRHMVSLALLVYRSKSHCNGALLESFGLDKVKWPMAPGEFLYLDKCHYKDYSKKVAEQLYGSEDDMQFLSAESVRQKFLKDSLYPHLTSLEASGVMQPWLDECYKQALGDTAAVIALLRKHGGEVPEAAAAEAAVGAVASEGAVCGVMELEAESAEGGEAL